MISPMGEGTNFSVTCLVFNPRLQIHRAHPSSFSLTVLIISALGRFMSGEDFQEEAVLAAVKPLKSPADFGDSVDPAVKARPTIAEAMPAAILAQASNSVDSAQTVESLFHQHNQRVFRTAYRVTGSAADAEDVLQTVFLRVSRGQEAAATAENT